MHKKPGILSGLVRLVLAIGCLFAAGCGDDNRRTKIDLPIYFTCDTHGRLEPCGCFTGQHGGLTRLKTVLDAEKSEFGVRVDIGDAIAGREDYDLIQYRYMLRAFAAMNYDALNVGRREAMLSLAQLQEIKRGSPVSILSANLFDASTGEPVFSTHRIVERDGHRVALIGVVDPRGLEEDLGTGLRVGDMASAITRTLAEIKGKADLVVLLAFTDEATLAELAAQFYELHVILGGKVQQSAQELRKENRSLISFVTNEARALGILRLRLRAGAPPEVFHHEIRLLHDRIPQAATFQQLAQAYRTEIRTNKLSVDDPAHLSADMVPGVRTSASYVGSERCLDCHPSAAAVWTKSRHAGAFEALVHRNADADPKCIGCHTVGFGSLTGYRREFGNRKLANVGCESCHGPGSLHVRRYEGEESIDFKYRPLAAGDCQKCHYGEFSRPFYWHEFWPAIKHGKEPARATARN
ncbi:MAG TPA: multiheme c-type cytochrome [Verrucomicrobiae bacterium]|nr:multiheme c-type cytochrome [Verrucomicrobiae bacterium]